MTDYGEYALWYPQSAATPLESVGHFYNRIHRRTPVSDLFFAPANLLYLKEQLEQALFLLTQEHVEVPFTGEVVDDMYDIVSRNEMMAYWGARGLQLLNEMFLDYETRMHYIGMRQRKLYQRYFITGDRMRVFPYGTPEKVTRGEVTIDPSGYMLGHPWGRRHKAYMKEVLHAGDHVECTRPYPHAWRT